MSHLNYAYDIFLAIIQSYLENIKGMLVIS